MLLAFGAHRNTKKNHEVDPLSFTIGENRISLGRGVWNTSQKFITKLVDGRNPNHNALDKANSGRMNPKYK